MRGHLTRQDAVKQWDEADKKAEQKQKESAQDHKWPFCMPLPCRHCSEQRGELPLTAFTSSTQYDAIWDTCLARGADLVCYRCTRELGLNPGMFKRQVIFCDDCCTLKLASEFAAGMHMAWRNMDANATISCKICTGERASKGRHGVDRNVNFSCSGPGDLPCPPESDTNK